MGGRVHPGHRCRDPEVQHRASILHIIILGRYTKMLVHIVDADTPLVLSRQSMAKIQPVVDIHRCTVTSKMTGLPHVCRGTGHFLLPLEGTKSRGDIPVTGGELAPGWSLEVMMVKEGVDDKINFTI